MSRWTTYEKQVMGEAADELFKVTRALNELPFDLGLVLSCHHAVIQSCRTILTEMAEDMYQQSREEV